MRTGKIARLPREIRAELNRRLQDGHCGRQLVDWLNSLPEVKRALAREFEGRPINEPNLTEWKQGGYREWEMQQELFARAGDLAGDAREFAESTPGGLADHVATVLAARYAAEMAAWTDEVSEEKRERLNILHRLCRAVAELQRGQQNAARVALEQARLDRDREKAEEEITELFQRWLEFPAVRDCACDQAATPGERTARLREIFQPRPEKSKMPAGRSAAPFSRPPKAKN